MYYPSQSPGVGHKLQSHHEQNPWARSHYGPPTGQPSVGPPPTSPGYALYTNPAVPHMQHHPGTHPHALSHTTMHHQQNSLSHYSSPQNGHTLAAHMNTASPGAQQAEMMTTHWQQQLLKCEMIRQSRSPHHRARASASALRNVGKSAIPITNPNAIAVVQPPTAEVNGVSKYGDAAGSTSAATSPNTPTSNAAAASTAVNHPSSTVAPIAEAPRPTAPKPPENTWTSLDMGGVNIKNLPPSSGIFSYSFLIHLYLNHNQLSVIPPQIARLKHLQVLDLSGNQLAELPPELGMLTELKELYLFDNQLSVLPYELGTLHQLRTIGIEGNPLLEPTVRELVQKDGTPALIAYLRDTCPVPAPPPPREWVQVITPAEREVLQADQHAETFSVVCYNILCERAATTRMYGYTPAWALAWDYRKEVILTEVMNYNADFLCLQEVDIAQYENYFVPALSQEGIDYEGVFWPKSRYKTMSDVDRRLVDGCATFFKKSKYQLVEKQLIEFSTLAMQRTDFKKTDDMFNRVLGKDHIAVVCLLENKETGTRLVLANAHIHWDAAYRDVKLVQTALLLEEVEKMAANFARLPPRLPPGGPTAPGVRPPPVYTDGTKIPVIICGDYNSVQGSGVCELFATGAVPPTHADFMSHLYGRYTSEGLRHRLGLKSAYAGAELPMTNFTTSFKYEIDYIWYSTQNLAVNAVLGEIDRPYLEKVVGFPNAHFPSDHICIAAEFRVKPPREASQPARPPPAFNKSPHS